MSRRRFAHIGSLAVAWTLVLCAAGAQESETQPPPQKTPSAQTPPSRPADVFRAGVDIVSLNVAVTDTSNRYVTDLDRDNFTVFEDGVKQDITFFSRTQLPISMALLLDTSASMEGKLAVAQEAAIGFARTMREQDSAEVVDFDSRVDILQKFTNNADAVEKAIRRTSAGGSTSLFNAIYIALKELKKVRIRSAEDVRRQAIVVLSDGEDTSSLVGFEEVLDLTKRSEVAIYAIGVRSRESVPVKGFKEAEFVLRQLALETGGRAFFVGAAAELAGVYDQIADELSSQYALGYSSKNPRRDGLWRRVVVRVNREDVTPRTKRGYYAPGSP